MLQEIIVLFAVVKYLTQSAITWLSHFDDLYDLGGYLGFTLPCYQNPHNIGSIALFCRDYDHNTLDNMTFGDLKSMRDRVIEIRRRMLSQLSMKNKIILKLVSMYDAMMVSRSVDVELSKYGAGRQMIHCVSYSERIKRIKSIPSIILHGHTHPSACPGKEESAMYLICELYEIFKIHYIS